MVKHRWGKCRILTTVGYSLQCVPVVHPLCGIIHFIIWYDNKITEIEKEGRKISEISIQYYVDDVVPTFADFVDIVVLFQCSETVRSVFSLYSFALQQSL